MDDRPSDKADFLTEIESSRVGSFDCQVVKRAKRPYYVTEVRPRDVKLPKPQYQSGTNDDEHELDRYKRKVRSLDTRVVRRPQPRDGDKMQGMLYKTSRGKITSDLTRGQNEHRQQRRFQLTEHSLEYSQLFQRVWYAAMS